MTRLLRSATSLTAAALLLSAGAARAADPTTADCLAASDSAIRAGNAHKLRAERSDLLVCAAASCPGEIRKECVARVDELNAQIPTVIFGAKDGAGNDLIAVKVMMDGEVLAERLEGTALSVDPGAHTFTFEADGLPKVTRTFLIQQAQKDRRELLTFGAPVVAPPVVVPPVKGGGAPLGTQRVLAIVAGGVGVAALGVGTAFGVIAMSQKSDAQGLCPGASCSTAAGVSRWSDAATSGNISTVGFIVGGVVVAGAAVLWFTAPHGASPGAPQVGLGPGSVLLRGVW